MNFKTGSVRRFFVQYPGRPDLGFMAERMGAHAHREIDPKSDVESSVGWCGLWDERPGEPIDCDVDVVGFGFRVDTLKVPGAVLSAKTRDACEVAKRELKLDTLNRFQIQDVKASVKRQLRERIPPRTLHVPVLWVETDKKNVIYLLTSSDEVVNAFVELFERTFETALVSDGIYARLKHSDISEDLKHYTNVPAFVRVGHSVDQQPPPAGASFLEHNDWWGRIGLAFLHHLAYTTTQEASSLYDRNIQVIDGGRADLIRGDEAVKFRKGSPLQSPQLGELLLDSAILQSVGVVFQGEAEDFKLTVTGWDLRLSGISLPPILADDPSEYVIELCYLLDVLHGVVDDLLVEFVMETSRQGLEGFDHIQCWAESISQTKV